MCRKARPTRSSDGCARSGWISEARSRRRTSTRRSLRSLTASPPAAAGSSSSHQCGQKSNLEIALEGTFPPSWYALLIIAGLIGAVGILTNSQILIVGTMVVGPEYGAILSLAFGATRRDLSRVLRSAAALGIGFALAVVGALLLSLVVRGAGLEPNAYLLGIRPVSNLIDPPTGSPLSSQRWPAWSAFSR
jgi:hypothetical protein